MANRNVLIAVRARFLTILLMGVSSLAFCAQRAGEEIRFPGDEFAKLDTFEGLNLEDGDKLFAKKDYKGAYAAYKAYSQDFPKGKAVAYALFRMGRCLHLLKKRNAAVKQYQEVVDYFPNSVRYAAGALYHMGEAHQENGDEKKCIATWARMVKDKDYVSQPNSGTALMFLAQKMNQAKEYEEAVGYSQRIAINFQSSNLTAARTALNSVWYHYAVRSPNQEKFKSFYIDTGGWDGWRRTKDLKDVENSTRYWDRVLTTVLSGDKREKQEVLARVVNYWLGKLGNKFAKNDAIQFNVIRMRFMADNDANARIARVNQQAERTPMTIDRYIWWIRAINFDDKAQTAFIGKHSKVLAGAKVADVMKVIEGIRDGAMRDKIFTDNIAPGLAGMKLKEQLGLLGFLTWHGRRMYGPAKVVLGSINLTGVTDKDLVAIAAYAGDLQGEEGALRFFNKMKDKQASLKAVYDWYLRKSSYDHNNFDKAMAEKALAMMPAIAKTPEWAQATLWPKARILHRLGQWPQAIKAYKAANRQPQSTWSVVDCLISMKDYKKAITTVKGLESVGGGTASAACLKVANIYKLQGDKGKEVEQLRLVLHRYPKSRESSEAHQRLEGYGAKITGGRAKAQD